MEQDKTLRFVILVVAGMTVVLSLMLTWDHQRELVAKQETDITVACLQAGKTIRPHWFNRRLDCR